MRRTSDMNHLTLAACLIFAFAFGFGCETQPSKANGDDKPAAANDNSANKATENQPKTTSSGQMQDISKQTKPATKPADQSAAKKPEQGTKSSSMSKPGADSSEEILVDLRPLHIERRPSGVRPTNRLDATSDLIYANVRIQMDVMVADRKAKLDQGADVTDPEIRQKEASIRKAVELLTQNGEYVEAIQPPIEGLKLPAGGD